MRVFNAWRYRILPVMNVEKSMAGKGLPSIGSSGFDRSLENSSPPLPTACADGGDVAGFMRVAKSVIEYICRMGKAALCLMLSITAFHGRSLADGFRRIGADEGLNSRYVWSVDRDRSGFVWFSTPFGMDRFDGTRVRHYAIPSGAGSLRAHDDSGGVWIASKTGEVWAYDAQTDSFRRRWDLTRHFAADAATEFFYIDARGRFLFAAGSTLRLFDPRNETFSVLADLPGERIMTVEQAGDESWYAGTLTGVFRIEPKIAPVRVPLPDEMRVEVLHAVGGSLFVGTFSDGVWVLDMTTEDVGRLSSEIPICPIRDIASSDDGATIAVATDGAGLCVVDGSSRRLVRRYTSDKGGPGGLDNNSVTCVWIDERGRFWAGVWMCGVCVVDPGFPEVSLARRGENVNAVFEDSDGDLWYGTDDGVSLYRTGERRWQHFLTDVRNRGVSVSSVVLTMSEDARGGVWVGGFGMGVWCVDKRSGSVSRIRTRDETGDGAPSDYIYAILADSTGVFMGGIEGPLARCDLRGRSWTYYPVESVGDIAAGADGELLIATCDGLVVLRDGGETIERYSEFGGTKLRYPIRCLERGEGRDVWMATSGDGLIRFNPRTGESRVFDTSCGLSSNVIGSLARERTGHLWFSCDGDLYRLDSETGKISQSPKLAGGEYAYNGNAFYVRRDGRLVLGASTGAIEFRPGRDAEASPTPKLLLTDLELLDRTVRAGEDDSPLRSAIDLERSIRLRSGENYFALSFSELDLSHSRRTVQSFMLEGFDAEWRRAGKEPKAVYSNVPSGDYRFRLRSTDRFTGEVVDERTLNVSIDKPIWASWWARLIYAAIAAGLLFLVVHYVRYRVKAHNSREKIRSFIDVAHDIRIPVSLILAPLSELEEHETLSPQGARSLATISRNVYKLLGMVNRLLDFRKADTQGATTIDPSEQSLRLYFQDKTADFRTEASQKGVELTLELDPELPAVWFDREVMDKIVDNLLSNAVKYTDKGSVRVLVGLERDRWTLEVRDTGIGIPASDRKHVFKDIYRAGNAVNSRETGSGIGLVLVARLVKLHGGEIAWRSVENEGSSFTASFPLSAHAPKEQTAVRPADKALLLLVENDDEMRRYLSESLSREYRVAEFSDGARALEQAQVQNPDIVVSDVLLPGLNGYDICRELKSRAETSHIPVILLTALSERDDIIDGLRAGADDYIVKPFDPAVLKARIRNILSGRERLRRMVFSAQTGLDTTEHTNRLDREFLDRATALVERELSNPDFSTNDFCRALGMSRTSTYNRIKTLTNLGPGDFVRLVRLNRARELLRTKRYTIGEVSDMVGFSDPKYFSTCFKKQFGVSPSKQV